jgi:hypothetical protein
MSERLLAIFPGLRTTPFRITSPADPTYNCIAWAGSCSTDWWWPHDDAGRFYWPSGASREVSLDAFRAAFLTLDFTPCENESFEPGFEKVALFADSSGLPTHAARQLPNGNWTSKLGQAQDIEHELRALKGEIYGKVALFLKRARKED